MKFILSQLHTLRGARPLPLHAIEPLDMAKPRGVTCRATRRLKNAQGTRLENT